MTTSISQFVGTLKRAPESLKKAQRSAVMIAATAGKPVMEHAPGAAQTVGGKRISVTVKPVGAESVSIKWGPPGWVRILNDPTSPHFIGPRGRGQGSLRKQGSRRGSRRATGMSAASLFGGTVGAGTKGAIGIPGVGARAWAMHPGTKGKHFVEAGKSAAIPVISKTYARAGLTEPLRQVFRG